MQRERNPDQPGQPFERETLREAAEALLAGRVLEQIATGAALGEVLEAIALLVEGQAHGVLCSVLVLDDDGVHLRHGAGPSLPAAYNGAIDGVAIGPRVGSCGTAAYLRRPVIVTDIAVDPLWTDFRDLAERHGLRACWSTPVFSSRGAVLGTFAMYYAEPRGPAPGERRLVRLATHLAAIAIERDAAERAQQRLLEELRAERRRLDAVLQQCPAAIVVADREGRLVLSNRQVDVICRAPFPPAGRVDDYRVWPCFHPDLTPYAPHEHPMARSLERGEIVTDEEIDIVRGDGTCGAVSVFSAPILDEQQRVAGAVTIFVDISGRRQLEASRESLLDELKQALRARDDFLSVASHELRTPLTAMRLQVDSLARQVAAGNVAADKLLPKLFGAQRQVDRLELLVGDLLDVSRVVAGRLRLRTETVDLGQLAQQVGLRFQELYAAAGSRLAFDVAGPVSGEWDPGRLDQVVANLLSNALKYGQGAPVRVAVTTTGDRARLRVTDQGIGIALAQQLRLFNRFERAVSERQYTGMGLGLWICREIVEAHGGTIDVASAPGTGSVFTVELPCRPAAPGKLG